MDIGGWVGARRVMECYTERYKQSQGQMPRSVKQFVFSCLCSQTFVTGRDSGNAKCANKQMEIIFFPNYKSVSAPHSHSLRRMEEFPSCQGHIALGVCH